MILLLACIILSYNRIRTESWKACASRGPVCTLEDFQWCAKPCFACAETLRVRCLPLIPRRDKRKSLLIWSVPYRRFFFIASGVGLSPLYCGHFWPIVPDPDNRWWWLWSNWWNEDWQGKPKCSEKPCPSATFSTINSTWPDPGSNPGRRGGKPATVL
jgi:hypothetical protein